MGSKTQIMAYVKGAFNYCDGVYSGITDAHLNDQADFWGAAGGRPLGALSACQNEIYVRLFEIATEGGRSSLRVPHSLLGAAPITNSSVPPAAISLCRIHARDSDFPFSFAL